MNEVNSTTPSYTAEIVFKDNMTVDFLVDALLKGNVVMPQASHRILSVDLKELIVVTNCPYDSKLIVRKNGVAMELSSFQEDVAVGIEHISVSFDEEVMTLTLPSSVTDVIGNLNTLGGNISFLDEMGNTAVIDLTGYSVGYDGQLHLHHPHHELSNPYNDEEEVFIPEIGTASVRVAGDTIDVKIKVNTILHTAEALIAGGIEGEYKSLLSTDIINVDEFGSVSLTKTVQGNPLTIHGYTIEKSNSLWYQD